ncbi:hypothetical protein NQZ68_022556 [Dissostichus eleginoides]|nr:hypothetical protein NQZ68_022556 [Dissostichus eleginoides]
MSLVCYGSPNIGSVDQLYAADTEEGYLYLGTGTPPFCNSTSPPLPSGCVVCVNQFIHAVCGDLLKNETLVMEGSGKHIKLIKSVCPTLLGNATNADMSGNNVGAPQWLLPVGIIFLILAIAIIAVVCGRKYWTKRRREPLKQIEEEKEEKVQEEELEALADTAA